MDTYGTEMKKEEIGAFLEQQGHGVLSFGGDEPYGLPISFGYDVENNRCIFQLVSDADSKKEAALDHSAAVSLVAYEWENVDVWRSVIIKGDLSPILDGSPDEIEAGKIFAKYASVASLTVFGKPLSELTLVWQELKIEEMTGRHSPRFN